MNAFVPPTAAPKTSDVHRLTVYFFRGNLLAVRLLQLLVGGTWQTPTHVVYSVDNVSYEILTSGVVCGANSPEALYRACQDCFSFDLTPTQAVFLHGYFRSLQEVGIKFDLWKCVRYCLRLLVLNFGTVFSFWDALDFGQIARVQPYETSYCPPFTCTTPMWEAVGEQPASWDAFVPAALYKHLTGETYTDTEELTT